MTDPPGPTRRDVLATACACAAGLGAAGTTLAWTWSLAPRVLYEPPPERRIGAPGRFREGVTFLQDERVFVVRAGDAYRALSAVCTHLGCTVQHAGEGFRCPCHGSSFAADGSNTGGPAPRPLPWRPLARAGDGSLVVDLSKEVAATVTLVIPGEPPK